MRRLVRVLGICAVVLIVATGCSALDLLSGSHGGFDAERWRAADQGCVPDNPRLGMVGELRDELMSDRPTSAEVVDLLGAPDGDGLPEAVRYSLGYNIIDCDSVEIQFGPDGRVTEVRYLQG